MGFLARYFRFGYNDLLEMDHLDRVKWVTLGAKMSRDEQDHIRKAMEIK